MTDTGQFIFNLTKKGLQINKEVYPFPIEIKQIELALGVPQFYKNEHPEGNHIYTWDDFGIYAFSKQGETTHGIGFYFMEKPEFDFHPKKAFHSILKMDNQDFKTYYDAIEETLKPWPSMEKPQKIGQHKTYFTIDDTRMLNEIQYLMPEIKVKKPVNDKYKYRKIDGEKLKFTDFNFKLAVIQVLMYEKELLQPKFDAGDFIALYHKREIDIEAEGYDFIPEITDYFKKLEIDKKYAAEITELYQEGGDDIYLNLIFFWDGEDDSFDITSAKDAGQFPNLKKVTVFGNPSEQLISDFKKKGIEAG